MIKLIRAIRSWNTVPFDKIVVLWMTIALFISNCPNKHRFGLSKEVNWQNLIWNSITFNPAVAKHLVGRSAWRDCWPSRQLPKYRSTLVMNEQTLHDWLVLIYIGVLAGWPNLFSNIEIDFEVAILTIILWD